jgi:hypothetical protein
VGEAILVGFFFLSVAGCFEVFCLFCPGYREMGGRERKELDMWGVWVERKVCVYVFSGTHKVCVPAARDMPEKGNKE